MFVELESLFGDVLVSGKVSFPEQLKYRMLAVLGAVFAKESVPVFCARYCFACVSPGPNIRPDCRIDLDPRQLFRVAGDTQAR